MRGQRVNDGRVVERPEVKFDYNFFFVKYSSCVKMTVGIGRRVVHIILEVQLCQQGLEEYGILFNQIYIYIYIS